MHLGILININQPVLVKDLIILLVLVDMHINFTQNC